MIYLVPATPEHVPELVASMRLHDKFEFEIAGGDPVKAIQITLDKSAAAWSALADRQIACMWGVKEVSLVTGAHLWLITTPLIEKHKHRFLAESKRVVDQCLVSYQFLYGYVDVQFELSIKWMKWLGFEMTSQHDLGKLTLLRFEQHYGN